MGVLAVGADEITGARRAEGLEVAARGQVLHGARLDRVELDAGFAGVVFAIEIGHHPKEAGRNLVLHLLGGTDVAHVAQGQDRRCAKRQAHALAGAAAIEVEADLFLGHEGALHLDAGAQDHFARVAVADPVALQPAGRIKLLAKQDFDAVVLVEVEPVRLHHLHLQRHHAVAVEQLRGDALAHQHRTAHGRGPGPNGLVAVPIVDAVEVALG